MMTASEKPPSWRPVMWKKLLAGVLTATLLGIGGIAVAGAVGSHGTTTESTTATSAAAHAKSRVAARLRKAAKIAADTIGISVTDLRDAIKGGQTVAQV